MLNIAVDPKCFGSVSSFRASLNALRNVRANMAKVIRQVSNTYNVTSECNTLITSLQGKNFSASIQEKNTVESLDGLMFILQDELPEKEENITRSSVLQSDELIKNNDVMPAFAASQYIIKSYS